MSKQILLLYHNVMTSSKHDTQTRTIWMEVYVYVYILLLYSLLIFKYTYHICVCLHSTLAYTVIRIVPPLYYSVELGHAFGKNGKKPSNRMNIQKVREKNNVRIITTSSRNIRMEPQPSVNRKSSTVCNCNIPYFRLCVLCTHHNEFGALHLHYVQWVIHV